MTEPIELPPPETPSLTRRRRTFLAPLWLLAWFGIAFIVAALIYWKSATTTTIVVLRHAEKQINSISDSPLSPPGELRAERLAQMFGDSVEFGRIGRIYVTDTRRTQQTAATLAQRLDIKPEIAKPNETPSEIARRALSENRGGIALVVGHSNTVPDIVRALADEEHVPLFSDEEFDTIYIVSVPTIGDASVLRMKY
ncbi:MAG: histidine phosphatase family protein [Steroidobacteraceae bacterium]|nr:histidine phosphatase family protein [Steroidobacteraceae bacterium]